MIQGQKDSTVSIMLVLLTDDSGANLGTAYDSQNISRGDL